MRYLVKRPHQGDKFYNPGDFRDAKENEVRHLLARGVLEKMAEPPKNKAAYVAETKDSPLADGPTGRAKPAPSSPAGRARKARKSKK
jgi:hypothetical protein